MSDSMSPDSNTRIPDADSPQREATPTSGVEPKDLGNPERGLEPTDASFTEEPGQQTPEHIHERRLEDTGSASPADSGDAPPEIAGDDQSLLRENPSAPPPRSST